jgi:hypothetical protein
LSCRRRRLLTSFLVQILLAHYFLTTGEFLATNFFMPSVILQNLFSLSAQCYDFLATSFFIP